jgi:hypothetical protein
MGWHYILDCTCQVKAEFLHLIDIHLWNLPGEYADLSDISVRQELIDALPPQSRRYLERWFNLGIGNRFYEFDLSGSWWTIRISKKVTEHDGFLDWDYVAFLQRVLVPLTTNISHCKITSDDFGDGVSNYRDAHLRAKAYSDSFSNGDRDVELKLLKPRSYYDRM